MTEQRTLEEEEQESVDPPRPARWYTHAGDFMNTLKAFIGINYQALPFSFAQSGLAFGIVGVFVIATLTDHCCQLLVSSKMFVIRRICSEKSDNMSVKEVTALQEHLEATLGYGDVGRLSFGMWCYRLIQFVVWFTQFIYLIIYFVFIGNTVSMIFPYKHPHPSPILPNCTTNVQHGQYIDTPSGQRFVQTRYGNSLLYSPNVAMATQGIGYCLLDDQPSVYPRSNNSSEFLAFMESNVSSMAYTNHSTASMSHTSASPTTQPTTAPDLRLVMLFPIPFFIATSMVRKVRLLAPFSVISTACLIGGALSVAGYLISGFKLSTDYVLISKQFKTVPIFLTQTIASYEGIGCVLPIHSSMVGTRHLFRHYMHASIYIIFVILCTFGTLGYLRYGSDVQQIIALQLPQHSVLAVIVDLTLIASVLFTYPIMCFPVIEITERFLFSSSGKFWQCSKAEGQNDTESLLPGTTCNDESLYGTIEQRVAQGPFEVATWKRNVTRVLLTLAIAGLAVLARDYFAYLGSFAGAIGASLLALIIPCSIDIRLRYHEMSKVCFFKNITIIVLAVVCSGLGLYSIGDKIASGGKP